MTTPAVGELAVLCHECPASPGHPFACQCASRELWPRRPFAGPSPFAAAPRARPHTTIPFSRPPFSCDVRGLRARIAAAPPCCLWRPPLQLAPSPLLRTVTPPEHRATPVAPPPPPPLLLCLEGLESPAPSNEPPYLPLATLPLPLPLCSSMPTFDLQPHLCLVLGKNRRRTSANRPSRPY
ncbi:hypothetical protein J5N97_028317 [Dioscorea zingiberensis]|uniref:Uncharacterized protein n=1 Tax=Dioscorea zingiberensis TaxID=325984 RepID=A0A9D5H4P9_9LILI|nr:hypothetical protein J5N97_028317 [Dioscorea zingiberensis]